MPHDQPIDIIYDPARSSASESANNKRGRLGPTAIFALLPWGGIVVLYFLLADQLGAAALTLVFTPLVVAAVLLTNALARRDEAQAAKRRVAPIRWAGLETSLEAFLARVFNSSQPNTNAYVALAGREIPTYAERYAAWGAAIRIAPHEPPSLGPPSLGPPEERRAEGVLGGADRDHSPLSRRRALRLRILVLPNVLCALLLGFIFLFAWGDKDASVYAVAVVAVVLLNIAVLDAYREKLQDTRALRRPGAAKAPRLMSGLRGRIDPADHFGDWVLGAGEIAYRARGGREPEVHRFSRSDALLIATRAAPRTPAPPWRVTLARRDGWRLEGEFSDREVNTLLSAWFTPASCG